MEQGSEKMMSKNDLFKITGLFFLWRIFLFGVGFVAPVFLRYDPSFPYAGELLASTGFPQWLYSWGGFDGVHYLTIIEKGYFGTGLIQAFFPLFPILGRIVSFVLENNLMSALMISNFFAWLALVLFYVLLKQDFPKIRWLALFLLLVFPTSFFFGAVYNESLFLSLVLGGFLLVRRKKWFWASLVVVAASATRIVGIVMIPALLAELWSQASSEKKKNLFVFLRNNYKKVLVILMGSLGLSSYMFYLSQVFGDPLYFLHLQNEFGAGRQSSLVLYPQVVWRYLKILFTARPFGLKYFSYVQDFVVGIGGLSILLISIKKIRPSYLVFAIGAFLIPTLTGTFSSMPRYTLVCFPIVIWLAAQLKNKPKLSFLVMTSSILLLILNTILFIQGYWVA